MKKEIITSVDPKSPVSEVFRTLRTNLQYLNKKDGAQTMVITSTVQGEGKSFVTANLAVTFAQAGKKVVIVDSDMRRPRQHKLFNINMYPGLSNYLSGVNVYRQSHEVELSECICHSSVTNLSIIPAGNIPPNPSELLQSERLPEFIDSLKRLFDIIIFDGAPCLLVTDATLVSRLVDATILVVAQRKTKIDELKEATNRINRVGGKVVGVVLNRVKISSKKYGEKYYYSSQLVAGKKKKNYDYLRNDEDNEIKSTKESKEESPNNAPRVAYKDQELRGDKTSTNREMIYTTDKGLYSDKIKDILSEINSYEEGKKK